MNARLIQFFLVCLAFGFAPEAITQPQCITPKYIETLNKGVLEKRLAHIKGSYAVVFIALDPIWSYPDFPTIPYRHPDDMAMIKKSFESLPEQGIDEIIVWEFRRPKGVGAAVPFKDGCAVEGYGEPDESEKLSLMNETYRHIREHGLNAPLVRDDIKKLLIFQIDAYRDESLYDESMIDIMIEKLRPLVTNPGPATEEN